MTRKWNAVLLLSLGSAAASCGNPADPASPTLPAGEGTYLLFTSALAGSPGAECDGTGIFAGASVVTAVRLTRSGDTVIARSATSADGTAEIRLVSNGFLFGTLRVTGTASGQVVDRRDEGTIGLVTLDFGGAGTDNASVDGNVFELPTPSYLGSMYGRFTVASSVGNGSCPYGEWGIREPEPCEIPGVACQVR